MSTEKFVYVTYIATTADKVWKAIIDGELARQYWAGFEAVAASGWKKGAAWQLVSSTAKSVHVVGEVLDYVPSKRLVLSWADPDDAANKTRHSQVAMDLETVGDMVRLTVTHDQLTDSMRSRITGGWPRMLSSLKSFLETGRPLAI